jgi:hypothetical protein
LSRNNLNRESSPPYITTYPKASSNLSSQGSVHQPLAVNPTSVSFRASYFPSTDNLFDLSATAEDDDTLGGSIMHDDDSDGDDTLPSLRDLPCGKRNRTAVTAVDFLYFCCYTAATAVRVFFLFSLTAVRINNFWLQEHSWFEASFGSILRS